MTTIYTNGEYEYEDDEPQGPFCEVCGSDMEWEDCDACGGEGEYDGYESDPLWYMPGEMERCEQCDGRGGWWWCLNAKQHEVEPEAA